MLLALMCRKTVIGPVHPLTAWCDSFVKPVFGEHGEDYVVIVVVVVILIFRPNIILKK